ncbi:PAS domain-containing protein [Arcobacter sp. CECT 8983]|uniref:PAS domain-containing protein n=1 Tax=Arcobacter sp. CECT 8983 TaxID=2044508 RepID=UPI00100B6E2E|nr:transporter substrate-binding domain-containing protein [Arcobacter sp. CECT 8983]
MKKIAYLIIPLIISLLQAKNILTNEEISFLKEHKELKVCIDPNWMPLEKNEKGKHVGMTADYLRLLEKSLNIKMTMVPTKTWIESLELGKNKKCDIFSLVMPTKERKLYLNFTKPYLEIPLVLATKESEVFIDDITKVKKTMGIVKGYAYAEILKEKYPSLDLVYVKNIEDGLKKVDQNKLFGFIGTFPTVGYNIQKKYVGNLKIVGKFQQKWDLGIGVRKDYPILVEIFNKAINNIKYEEHQEILNKWLSIKYEKITYKYLFEIILVFFFVLGIIIFVNRKLSNEIKKRKRVESHLKRVIQGAKLGTWTWNIKEDRNIINNRLTEIIGYSKEELSNKNHLSFILEEDRPLVDKALEEHIKGNQPYEVCFRMKAKDGSIKWILSNGSIVKKDKDGNPIIMAGIYQDVTESKKLELELKRQNEFIVQQSRQAAMGEMLENIAHQWRQPLSIITTSASGVKIKSELSDLNQEQLFEFMDQIIKGGMYLSQTIEDFRNFFKKDKKATNIQSTILIEKSLQFLKSKINNREIEVITDIQVEELRVYENEFIQALINIFSNAIDALEKVENKKYIFITIKESKNNYIIEIKDSAKGIEDKILPRIFDPYFTTKHQSQGTGIGLYMTKEIIEKHFLGKIEVKNEDFNYQEIALKGACFKIKIPKMVKDL